MTDHFKLPILAARNFSFDPTAGDFPFALPGYNLILLADSVDTQNGHIDVSSQQPGSIGQLGLQGIAGKGMSGDGGPGEPGGNRANLRIICKQLVNLRDIEACAQVLEVAASDYMQTIGEPA